MRRCCVSSMRSAWRAIPLALWVAGMCAFVRADAPASDSSSAVVFYFHRTLRCPACLNMEEWTRQVVESLPAIGESSKPNLRIVNLDEPGQERRQNDFGVEFTAVILAEIGDDRPLRWKNLEDIWAFSEDESVFKGYLEHEIALFQSAKSGAL